jgi:hypothetical protein
MIAAYSTALSGLNNASTSLAERAGRIVRSSTLSSASAVDDVSSGATTASSGGDLAFAATGSSASGPYAVDAADQRDNALVNDLVGLGYDKTAFKANLAVLRSAREMEERLLDIVT